MATPLTLSDILLNPLVTPTQYYIELEIDLESFKVRGSASVGITISKAPVNALVLHSVGLKIDPSSVTWTSAENAMETLSLAANGLKENKEAQTVSFNFGKELQPDKGVLRVKWEFELDDSLAGLYRSKYTALSGETKYMAVTQFEATDDKKAKFGVVLVVPEGQNAISNMPVQSCTHLGGGKVKYVFDTTPIMSTYLLAVIVGEFDYVSVLSGNDIRTTVYTPRGKSKLGEHALRVASAALPFFEEQFGVKYPLPKSDLLAIPDFAAGAMENWGAVTYRESRLLIDEKSTSITTVQRCTRTVCHELAHMWFGNYVTMQWWTHLWLNEGFARFMEFKATDHIFPEWKIWLTFCFSVHGSALDHDALKNSHPVQVPVKHPDEINEIFDLISYAKGASIIRMLSDYLGEDTFMKGIHSYLKAYSYGNAKTENLWQHLGEASSRPVQKIMDYWTTKTGFPVVFITEKSNNDSNKRSFQLEQQRFGENLENDTTVWQIPIRISTGGGESRIVLMTSPQITVEVSAKKDEFIRFNSGKSSLYLVIGTVSPTLRKLISVTSGQVGFFRCCYTTDSPAFQQLATAVESKALKAADRLGLQSDAFACARFGFSPLPLALELAQRYKDEEETPVIQELGSNLRSLLKVYRESDVGPKLSELVIQLFKAFVERLGWEKQAGEPLPHSICRVSVINTLFAANEDKTVKALHGMFLDRSAKELSADLRQLSFKAAVKSAPADAYDQLLDIYNTSTSAEERRHAMIAFASSGDPKLQARTLEWVLSSGQLRIQDLSFPVDAVAHSPGGAKIVWKWFTSKGFQKYEYLSQTQQGVFSSFVSAAIEALPAEEVPQIKKFFQANKVPCAERAIKQALEVIDLREQQKQRELPVLRSYFGI